MEFGNIEQRTEEWHQARLGKVTGSRVSDVLAKTKTGYSASRANYMAELICERLTGAQAERFTNAAMQWGTDNEPAAKSAYSFMTDNAIDDVGFVIHATHPDFGASPDGMIGADGLVEIKCPNTATHIDTLLSDKVPSKYNTQMQWQMACTGRAWCDFISYDSRMPGTMQLSVTRVNRNDARIAELEAEVAKFHFEIDDKIASLIAICGAPETQQEIAA